MNQPQITAVVTTYNRCQLLLKTILSLAAQTLDRSQFEVIIIDDGSVDDTRITVDGMASILSIKYAYQANSGLASAKNHGLFLASAPIVLFLDDDDVASPDLLEQHLAAHRIYPGETTAILGHTDLAPDLHADILMNYVTQHDPLLFSYQQISDPANLRYDHFWGGRTSCKRTLLLRHGVFNPVFRFGYEDIELGYRLDSVGLRVIYWKQAVNMMIRKISLDGFLRRCLLQGESSRRFLEMHDRDPEIYQYLDLDRRLDAWKLLAPKYDQVVRSARKLDSSFRKGISRGYSLPDHWQTALHLAYHRAFLAVAIKGYIDASTTTAIPG